MFAIVINKSGYKVEFIVLNKDKKPQFYTLKESEKVIEKDWQIANSMNKPKWNFDTLEWEETEPKDDEQIDNCSPIPTNEELNNQLVETQKLCLSLQKQILLK